MATTTASIDDEAGVGGASSKQQTSTLAPNQTLYINNLNDKIKKDGTSWIN